MNWLCKIGFHRWFLLDVMNGPECRECERCHKFQTRWPIWARWED